MKTIKEAMDRSSLTGKKWEDYDYIICPDGEKIDMGKLLDDQNRAKAALIHLEPVFGGFISRLRPVYTFQIPTQATDGASIFINPQFTNKLDMTGKVFVMAHEIMHCVLNHMRRGKGHDPERSNIAADYECNITIAAEGIISTNEANAISIMKKLGAYVDKKYAGWGYERIYDDCPSQSGNQSMSNQNQSGQASQNQGQCSNGQGQGQGQGQSNSQNSNGQGQGGEGSESSSGQSGKGSQSSSGNSGQSSSGNGSQGGQNGQSGPSRTSANDENTGVVRPEDCIGQVAGQLGKIPGTAGGMISREMGDAISEAEGYPKEGGSENAVEREWKDAAIKASSKMNKGHGAGSLKSKIDQIYMTTTDWKKELRNVIGHAISPDEKRQAYANKNVLTAQNRISRTDKDQYDNLDYMMVWIDSSGSMSDEQLRLCLSEAYAIALAKKPITMVIVQCDTKIQEIKEYHSIRELQRDLKHATVKGRGGTELKPCWDLLAYDKKYSRRPAELVMVFTDGYLDQHKRDPRHMRTLCWCILDNPGFRIQYKDVNTKLICLNTEDIK